MNHLLLKCYQQLCDCVPANADSEWEVVTQCPPWYRCWDVQICWLSLSWAFYDVSSMDPEGKRPSLRGHEKGTGRLSQHLALAWGLLKAQAHILPDFIFLFLFPLSLFLSLPVFLSWKGRIQHGQRVFIYFFSHEWLMAGEMPAGSDRNLWWTVKHVFVYCFAYGLHKQSYSQLCPSHLQQ